MSHPKQLTPWFSGNVKPEHKGMYQRIGPAGNMVWSKWGGEFWCEYSINFSLAEMYSVAGGFQDLKWRGLAHDPSNQEQHELAARAAGLLLLWKTGHCKGGAFEVAFVGDQPWRPKEDDGDALRLAVACGIEVGNAQQYLLGLAVYGGKEFWEINPDLFTAARLAIFRAAVDIGKAMP